MNISIISTVKNESNTLKPFLNSLLRQNCSFDEIIVVDGGSNDGTLEILKEYSQTNRKIKFLKKYGNISVGRNAGAKYAGNDILAFIDGGCIAKDNWLKELTKPFQNKNVDVVAGFYDVKTPNAFSTAAAPFHGVLKRRFNRQTFLPSARSLAVKKDVFNIIGGFNEKLYWAGEDTLFSYQLSIKEIRLFRTQKAQVYWTAPTNLLVFVKKSFFYALGDAQTSIWWHPVQRFHTHSIKIISLYLRYSVFTLLLLFAFCSKYLLVLFILLMFFYLSWSVWKLKDDVKPFKSRILIPVIQLASDISVMSGFLTGLLFFPKISL